MCCGVGEMDGVVERKWMVGVFFDFDHALFISIS
jgi:hypothetical protein